MNTYKPKKSIQLFRDCLRLIEHMAGKTSIKSRMLRKIVADEFRKNKDVSDPATLHQLKSSAEKGLSNYLLFERAKQDPKVSAAAAKLDAFEDDENGNLVRVLSEPKTTTMPSKSKPSARKGKTAPELK